MAEVRYLVADVDAAVAFYTSQFGFVVEQQFGPAMAILRHGDLALWVAGPLASASKPMPDGVRPTAGSGWARIVLRVTKLAERVAELRAAGVAFRSEITVGPGGHQILCLDPSGNLIELFEPR